MPKVSGPEMIQKLKETSDLVSVPTILLTAKSDEESKKAKALGFNGKAAIHPNQLDVIKSSFLPNEREIYEAKEIIKAFKKSSSAVMAFNGRMIDQPIILSMEKRLRLVGIDPKNID